MAEAIFADYVRGRLAALRDHYAAQGRPASEEALLFAAIADCEMAILGPNALPLWQEVQRLKDALEPQSPTTADGPAALELSWVPLNKRDLNWHAHATTQLRAMHAALRAAEKTPRDPLEIEELWDEANDLREKYDEYGPEVYELFARLLERSHGIGAEHG